MSTDEYNQLVNDSLALPPQQRGELVNRLIDSLATRPQDAHGDDEIAREVQRRSAELDSGEVVGIPWLKVREELRARIPSNDR